MKTVHKFVLQMRDYVTITMPKDAKILKISKQYGDICLWALVDTENELINYEFRIAGTGHMISDNNLEFIETIDIDSGRLIFHVFLIKEK